MNVASFTKSGTKSTTAPKIEKNVFGLEVKSHELLKQAYLSYLANGRNSHATTKTRGLVSGGGKKPWRQKGTGRARVGSSRTPVWRGGGIVFGPTGNENHTIKLHTKAKRQAVKQALSLANQAGKIMVVESFAHLDGKTKDMANFLNKIGANGKVLCVVADRDPKKEAAVKNLANVKLVSSNYLTVFDILNADYVVIASKALEAITDWLAPSKAKKEAK
jgi:large subunit ribosomal protein L4